MFISFDCSQTDVQQQVEDALVATGLGDFCGHRQGCGILITDHAPVTTADKTTAHYGIPPETGAMVKQEIPPPGGEYLARVHLGVDFIWPDQASELMHYLTRWCIGEGAHQPSATRSHRRPARRGAGDVEDEVRVHAPTGPYPVYAFAELGGATPPLRRLCWELAAHAAGIVLDFSDDPGGWKLADQYGLSALTWEQIEVRERVAAARIPRRPLAVLADRRQRVPAVSTRLWQWMTQLLEVRPLFVQYGVLGASQLASWELTVGSANPAVDGETSDPTPTSFWSQQQWVVAGGRGRSSQWQARALTTRLHQLGATTVHSWRAAPASTDAAGAVRHFRGRAQLRRHLLQEVGS